MSKKVKFVFFVDVSGSMYGKKIAAVNAVMYECISELEQINPDAYDIDISVFGFSDSVKSYCVNAKSGSLSLPELRVEKQKDGFYRITSFRVLYEEIVRQFGQKNMDDGSNGKNTYVVLITDGKPVDANEYGAAYDAAINVSAFKNAHKMAAFVDDTAINYTEDMIKFVDYNAKQIFLLKKLTAEFTRLRVSTFTDQSVSDDGYTDDMFE